MEWHEEDEWKKQWEEVKKMEESLKQKRVDECVRQVEALQRVPKLVADQRMSHCEKVEGLEEEKKSEWMVHRGNEEKVKQCFGGRHGGNDRLEGYGPT